jgi:hypothetical protein
VKKQATKYEEYCIEKADIYRRIKEETDDHGPIRFWTDGDFDKEFDMFQETEESSRLKKPLRFFKAWEEEWEQGSILNKDPVNEAKLLTKYEGLRFFDPDTQGMLQIENKELDWRRRRKDTGGYHLICYPEDYDEKAENCKDGIEFWAFCEDLRYCIAEYYKKNNKLGVQILEKDGGGDNEDDDSSSTQDVLESQTTV